MPLHQPLFALERHYRCVWAHECVRERERECVCVCAFVRVRGWVGAVRVCSSRLVALIILNVSNDRVVVKIPKTIPL